MSLQTLNPNQPLVIRTYRMGVRFHGNRDEQRAQEKEANQRVKGLQVRQEDILHNKNAINAAMGLARFGTTTMKHHYQTFATKIFTIH